MEKRRRARINASLTELKSLLLDAIKKEGARQNKMEKADILELAVTHFRQIQRQQVTGDMFRDTATANRYLQGFNACMQEVSKYLESNSDEDVEMKTRLLNHLANCLTPAPSLQATSSPVSSPSLSLISSTSSFIQVPLSPVSAGSLSPSSSFSSPKLKSFARVEVSGISSGTSSGISSGTSSGISSGTSSGISSGISSSPAKGKERFVFTSVKSELRPKISSTETPQQKLARLTSDAALKTVTFTSSPTSVLVKKEQILTSSDPSTVFCIPSSTSFHDKPVNIVSLPNNRVAEEAHSTPSPRVTEVNNNSILLPTIVKIPAPNKVPCLPQQTQTQAVQLLPQQTMTTHSFQPAGSPQSLPSLLEGSGIFTGSGPLQLIPTKTANGDIAFILSATHLMSSAHIPSVSIPIITQQTLNPAQLIPSTGPQQPIHFTIPSNFAAKSSSIPQTTQAPQPECNPSSLSAYISSSPAPVVFHQSAPLNLSSSHHASQALNRPSIQDLSVKPRDVLSTETYIRVDTSSESHPPITIPRMSNTLPPALNTSPYIPNPLSNIPTTLSNIPTTLSDIPTTLSHAAPTCIPLTYFPVTDKPIFGSYSSSNTCIVQPTDRATPGSPQQDRPQGTTRPQDQLTILYSESRLPQNSTNRADFFRPWKET